MIDIVRIDTNQRMSRVVIHDGKVYLSGLTADDRSADIKGQTAQVLAKIAKYLEKAGTDKAHLLTAQIWLKDIAADFAAMNEVWSGWTSPNAAPSRATAQCQMASPEILVEIVVTAAIPF
ncbi:MULTISPECIES: RidA family protein [Rhizobium/Agrobacterium group]|uniref:Cytochrome C2 n=2 Tax=Rhizobium/Agrobacterium group TaxID=227290 RepID=A0ABR5CKT3_9HYPH|nr:RidA family protein [Rhizobium nepotum]KJF65335.1 cytochrome C2 [Rhizobium nepotum 39/7]KJF70161.1 cytochrome C2 [Agrobacterium arsenijevicii]